MKKEERLKEVLEYRISRAQNEPIDDMDWFIENTIKDVLEAVNPFPSDLDEAAREIAHDVCKKIPDGEEKDNIVYYAILAAKAGAEWMRGQGETYTTHVEDASNDEERFPAIFIPVDSFKPGNKVVVQIRKKY